MTTKVHIAVNNPLLSKVVVEVWQKNHVIGENKIVSISMIDTNALDSFSVWPEQYLIVREARAGEQI